MCLSLLSYFLTFFSLLFSIFLLPLFSLPNVSSCQTVALPPHPRWGHCSQSIFVTSTAGAWTVLATWHPWEAAGLCRRLNPSYILGRVVKTLGSFFCVSETTSLPVYNRPLKNGPYWFEREVSDLHIPPSSMQRPWGQERTDTLRAADSHTCDFFWFHSITASTLFLWVSICNFPCLFPFLGLCLVIGWKINVCTLLFHLMNLRKLRKLRHLWHSSRKCWKV